MLFLLICLQFVNSIQNDLKIEYLHDFFEVDHLGNVYTIRDSEIVKFDPNGKPICSYSNSGLGEISSVDVSDPLRILIFYQDFNQIVFLDRHLAKIGNEIHLYDYSDNDTDLVCSSQKSGFWMFNSIDNQAFHISSEGEIVTQSILLNLFFQENVPKQIYEFEHSLFLLYEEHGILHLDQNGQFLKKISIPGIESFQATTNALLYVKNQSIYKYDLAGKADSCIYKKNHPNENKFKVRSNAIYTSNQKTIRIQQLNF